MKNNEVSLTNIQMVPENMSIAAFIDHLGSDVSMDRQRSYNGQSHTQTGTRGSQLIFNLTFRDVRDCFIRAYILSHEHYKRGTIEPIQPNATLSDECKKGEAASICDNDIYTLKGDADPLAVWQNMACEIEKMMGIYPNVPGLKED